MKKTEISLPDIVSRERWLAARKELLDKEKQLTRQMDELNAQRRRLPMTEVEAKYTFTGPEGEMSLIDLFHGRRQLIVYCAMLEPGAAP